MKREEVQKYLGETIKIILKGSGNYYHGKVITLGDSSFVIIDKFNNQVTIDYELCGLITPIERRD